jgi:hypothetical protein
MEQLLSEETIRKFAQFQNKQRNNLAAHVNGLKYKR